ncbi:hypothetical protein F5Y15DRAFT_36621 [Xylariaceae sp. FL0016]|nr:hypothetical protein F5Y15DRAFT_36621 [Xylariaceae sp. FL0016]
MIDLSSKSPTAQICHLAFDVAMLKGSRRRNGSQASCEPCRKRKTRCDHQKPKCTNCQRRGLDTQCWYHPAPLSKQQITEKSKNLRSLPQQDLEPGRPVQGVFARNDTARLTTSTKDSHRQSRSSGSPKPYGAASLSVTHTCPESTVFNEHQLVAREIVSQLQYLPLIAEHVRKYLAVTQSSLVPRTIISRLVEAIPSGLENLDPLNSDTTRQLDNARDFARRMIDVSSTSIAITPSLTVDDFIGLFCGENLRVETLGLLCTIALRSYIYHDGNNDKHGGFVQKMIHCSNSCLQLARELSPEMNDVIVWLAQENVQLSSVVDGVASLGVWRRVSSLVMDVSSLSLHRETHHCNEKMPFYLSESRRKTLAVTFHIDKVSASTFNRPPCLPALYVDCRLPIDISEEDLFSPTAQTKDAVRHLVSSDGWGLDQGYRSTTWARIRFILAEYWEEVVEHEYRSVHGHKYDRLQDLSRRYQDAWDTLPSYLRYTDAVWDSDLSSEICFLLGKTYLSYLHIRHRIGRMLEACDASHRSELLEVSATILATGTAIGKARNRAYFLDRDIPGVVCIRVFETCE